MLLYEHTFFFRVFDQDGDGNISRRELKNAMISFGQIFSAEEAEEMFNVTIYFFILDFPKCLIRKHTIGNKAVKGLGTI